MKELSEGMGYPVELACEVVELARSTYYYPSQKGSNPSVVSALRELAGDVGLAERLGRRARARAEAWTWDEVARRTLRVYGEVLSRQA